MRYLAFIGMAVVAGAAIRVKSEYRNRILAILGVIVIVMNLFYNARIMDKIISFAKYTNQTVYNQEYAERGEYPDALLIRLFKDRTVYVKNDVFTVEESEDSGRHYMYMYHHAKDMQNYVEGSGGTVIKSDDMNDVTLEDQKIREDFYDLGPANDMFRYSFMYNGGKGWTRNYFSYYWYYSEYLKEIHVYLLDGEDSAGDTVFTADELAVMWNTAESAPEEDFYIMTKDYYDKEVAVYE